MTKITAIEITQSAAGDNLRGVQDHQKVYTLKIENNYVNPTDTVNVETSLPADLEFLGCGQVDNTLSAATNPGSFEEYVGAGSLAGRLAEPANCQTPKTVETLESEPNGLSKQVYTKIAYELGNMAPGEVRYIRYVAGIPIRENTTTWTETTPSPSSL